MTAAATSAEVVRIQRMRRRHIRAVHRIDRQVYPRPWSMALYQQELSRPGDRHYRIARIDGVIVGYAGLMVVGADGHVTSVAVDPPWQGHQVASRLLLAVFRAAIESDCRALTLEVRASNHRAQDVYRRFGFGPAGVRKGYYQAEKEDALIMWAHDVDEPDYLERLRAIETDLPGTTRWEDR